MAENVTQSISCIMRPGIEKEKDLHAYSVHLLRNFLTAQLKTKKCISKTLNKLLNEILDDQSQ